MWELIGQMKHIESRTRKNVFDSINNGGREWKGDKVTLNANRIKDKLMCIVRVHVCSMQSKSTPNNKWNNAREYREREPIERK